MENNKSIYVVLSQTGSIVSSILKLFTKDKYNHVSISLDSGLKEMCSFGRYYTYFPFWGGFVHEDANKGVMGNCKNAQTLILRFDATEEQISNIKNKVEEMFNSKKKYRYDMIGVFLALFNKKLTRKRRFYCSEFVKEILALYGVIDGSVCPKIMKPMDFLSLNGEKIYEGNLHAYVDNLKQNVAN